MALRERISEVLGKHHTVHKNDLSVPVSTIPAFIKELREVLAKRYPTFEPVIFGHIGDGNLHVNILKPPSLSDEAFFKECNQADPMIFEVVKRFGGSISAEHGVGLLKMPYLHFSRSPAEIALLKGIKDVFDPRGILNPRKVFSQ